MGRETLQTCLKRLRVTSQLPPGALKLLLTRLQRLINIKTKEARG